MKTTLIILIIAFCGIASAQDYTPSRFQREAAQREYEYRQLRERQDRLEYQQRQHEEDARRAEAARYYARPCRPYTVYIPPLRSSYWSVRPVVPYVPYRGRYSR